jgi:dipeptidyl-peptidase III
VKDNIYAGEPEASLFIGKRDQGQVSNYYLGEPITDEEVAAIQTAAEKIEIDILNTRYARPLPLPHTAIWSTSRFVQCPEERPE